MNFKELIEAIVKEKGLHPLVYTTVQDSDVFFSEL